ncbi:MAG: non-hydrolyzing UDP-N-acetylglucosamine 2-epimerase [Bacteroidota bacterium]
MKKIITVLGARPQFIKAAAVSRVLRSNNKLQEKIVHTGQHYDYAMSDVFFRELDIPEPEYNLGIGSGLHGSQTGEMLKVIEGVLIKEKPDVVIVYGDTNSTLAGALAAAKLHIPIAHIEAGLRSFNRRMPEEVNRVLTDHLSAWLFAPTQIAVNNLAHEGIDAAKVFMSGDVMYDAVLFYSKKIKENGSPLVAPVKGPFILGTIHRAENTDDPARLKTIFSELDKIAVEFPVVVPLHPRTVKMLNDYGWKNTSGQLYMISPVGYLDMLRLQQQCALIITDSGGLQKEAYFMGKHCLTLRNETEWVELVQHGVNDLVIDMQQLSGLVKQRYNRVVDPNARQLYGAGAAAHHIVQTLADA